MFRQQIHPFDPFQRHELVSGDGLYSLSFVPGHGTLWQARLQGRDLLATTRDGQELFLNRWARGNFLFPFPNRLRDGQFTWHGQAYRFPINDAGTGNALHGFFGQMEFKLEEAHCSERSAHMVFRHLPDPPPANFPFRYLIRQRLSIHLEEGITVTTEVQNLNENDPMPVAWGWHPYFKLAGKLEDWTLSLPECQLVGIDDRMLPTGKTYAYDLFKEGRALQAERLDNCFQLSETEGRATIRLRGENGTLHYWQEAGPGKYPFFQLFIPPDRASLAIEPMSSNIDAFNNSSFTVIPSLQTVSSSWGIHFIPN